jgi:AhpD family alkylhydroperoxidase
MADNPLVLETYAGLSSAFARGSLNPLEQQIVLMATSYANQCTYCMAAHSTFAKAHGASDNLLNTVRAGKLPDDPRLAALVGITRQIARQHGEVSDEDICNFLEAGFTRGQLLEILIGVTQSTLASFVHRTAGTPLDTSFHPQAWPI